MRRHVICSARYHHARIVVDADEKLEQFKRDLNEGDKVVVEFSRAKDFRTRMQQRLLHGLLGRYARANGLSLDHAKMAMKIDCGYYEMAARILSGEAEMPNWNGRFVDLNKFIPVFYPEYTIAFIRSESSYTKTMEGELIDLVILRCNESGVYIEDILESIAELKKEVESE